MAALFNVLGYILHNGRTQRTCENRVSANKVVRLPPLVAVADLKLELGETRVICRGVRVKS